MRPAGIRFPQNDVGNPCARRQILHLPGDLIVKILRHVFRRRIHALERFEIVHELVVEPSHYFADHLLELREVHQETDRIELRSLKRHAHAIIVAMHVLAFALVSGATVIGVFLLLEFGGYHAIVISAGEQSTKSKIVFLIFGLVVAVQNILNALEKGKRNAAWQHLTNEERHNIQQLEKELISTQPVEDYKKIRAAIEALNKATTKLAEMMMDSAVSTALRGKEMNDIESEGPKSPHPIAPAEIYGRD